MVSIKVCGITSAEDLHLAQELGADYVGFIFFAGSPRGITANKAKEILRQSDHRSRRVGVFVNENAECIRRIFMECSLDTVQLHGEESPDFCRDLGLPCWKAIRVRDESSLQTLSQFSCEAILLDAFVPHAYGGSGRRIDPAIVAAAIKSGSRIVVAGGISIENVGEVMAMEPYGVDVGSALEEAPGKKDEAKMREWFRIVNAMRGCK